MNISKLIKSFGFAFEGVHHALRHNQNLQIHFLAVLVVVIGAWFYKVTHVEQAILAVTILVALSAEMINTALEEMTNLITVEHRKEAKAAKDVAAGMVLITATGSIIIAVIIFSPYIFRTI
jgi:diacylglycerol kinase (ATP)